MDMDLDVRASGATLADRGPAAFAVTAATLVLASIFVGARIICRYFIVRHVTWDDGVMMLAWLIAFFLSFTICLGVANGLGKRDVDISDANWPTLRRCEYVFSILYNPALMATKTSILIFYLRLASNTQVILRYASWATFAVVNTAGIVLTFMNIFQCRPTSAAWDPPTVGKTKCIPLLTEFICAAPVNIVTDLAILALPIPVLTGMRLPVRQKTILVFTFTLGIFVAIVDVVRIYYLQRAISSVPTGLSTDPNSGFGGEANFAYNAAPALLWSAVEVNVGIACACVPTLKPLILKLLPSMLYDPNGTSMLRSQEKRNQTQPSTDHADEVTRPDSTAAHTLEDHSSEDDAQNRDHHDIAGPLSMTEFLTMPGQEEISDPSSPGVQRPSSRATRASMSTNPRESVYFGFVNMTRPKSMLKTNVAESWKYCTTVSILFLLWGFSYGLLNTLNNVVAMVNNMTEAQTLGLTSAYFGGGYFFGPLLVGEWILRRDEHNRTERHRRNETAHVGGFKVTFIIGLCIYGIGTIIFWPSAVTASFGGFMLSSFVVGFGLSVLEVGANAFVILCGPKAHGETRILLAQGVQAIGSVLSNVLAQKVFFKDINGTGARDSKTLINVQWTYLGVTLLSVALGLFFYYMPLPEVSDSELEEAAKQLPIDPQKRSFGGLQLRTVCLILAFIAQYTYVAAQESNSTYFNALITWIAERNGDSRPDGSLNLALSPPDYLLIGHSAFAVSRFLAAALAYFSVGRSYIPKPRVVLLVSVLGCVLFSLLEVVIRPSDSDLLVIPSMLYFFCEGPIYPLVFAIGLRGQGRRTKRAAAFITMGASGPAAPPFVMYGIIHSGGSVPLAFIVVLVLSAATAVFPIFHQFVGDAKILLDPPPPESSGDENREERGSTDGGATLYERRRSSTTLEEKRSMFWKLTPGKRYRGNGNGDRTSSPAETPHATP